MEKEFEVKILNIDIDVVKKKLEDLGAKFLKRENQENIHITSNNFKFIEDGNYLRTRTLKDDFGNEIYTELTFKENIVNDKVRENNEYNLPIEDRDTLFKILDRIGYDNFDVGLKTRFSYSFKNSVIDLDIWDEKTYPYPYMEIEVKNYEDLYDVLDSLKIGRENISLKSLKELQDELGGNDEGINRDFNKA